MARARGLANPEGSCLPLVLLAFAALGTRFHRVALQALLETCRELALPAPTLPP